MKQNVDQSKLIENGLKNKREKLKSDPKGIDFSAFPRSKQPIEYMRGYSEFETLGIIPEEAITNTLKEKYDWCDKEMAKLTDVNPRSRYVSFIGFFRKQSLQPC